jgi:hypothetical protein
MDCLVEKVISVMMSSLVHCSATSTLHQVIGLCGIFIGEKRGQLKLVAYVHMHRLSWAALGSTAPNFFLGCERGIAILAHDQTSHKSSSRCLMLLSVVLRVPRSHS